MDTRERYRQMIACESEDLRDRIEGVPPCTDSGIEWVAHHFVMAGSVLAKLIERAGDGFNGSVTAEISIRWDPDRQEYIARAEIGSPVLQSQPAASLLVATGRGESPSGAQLRLYDVDSYMPLPQPGLGGEWDADKPEEAS